MSAFNAYTPTVVILERSEGSRWGRREVYKHYLVGVDVHDDPFKKTKAKLHQGLSF